MEQRALSDSCFGLETDDYVQLPLCKVNAKLYALLDIPHQGRGAYFRSASNFPSVSTCFLASILSKL